METATQKSFISNVPDNYVQSVRFASDGLPPRATRYGAIPIQPITGLPSNSISLTELPPNQFTAFNVFSYLTTDSSGRAVIREVEPANQIIDMHTQSGERQFCEFLEIARLGNTADAGICFDVLVNPHECDTYPGKLGNKCATCWLAYLNSPEFETKASNLPGYLTEVVRASAGRWSESLTSALAIANFEYQRAMEDIESPKSGKNVFYEYDYINMWHLHNKPPQFRRSNSPTEGLGDEIGKAFARIIGQNAEGIAQPQAALAAPQVDLSEITALLKNQQEEINALRKQLTSTEAGTKSAEKPVKVAFMRPISPPRLDGAIIAVGNKVQLPDGAVGTLTSKSFGRNTVVLEDGSVRVVKKEELVLVR